MHLLAGVYHKTVTSIPKTAASCTSCCKAEHVGSMETHGDKGNQAVPVQDYQQQAPPCPLRPNPQSLHLFLEGFVLSVERVPALPNRSSFFECDSN